MFCLRSHGEMTEITGRDETGDLNELESSRPRLGSFPRGTADKLCANGSAACTFQDNAEVAPCPASPASAAVKIDTPILVWFIL